MIIGIQRLAQLDTPELTDILVNIDNGLMDSFLERTHRYGEMEDYRKAIINILIARYVYYRENMQKVEKKEIRDLTVAYNLYLRFYI